MIPQHTIAYYFSGLTHWIRFNKPVSWITQEAIDDGIEFLVICYIPKSDRILLPAPQTGLASWDMTGLLLGAAEISVDRIHWHRVGYSPQRGQISPEDISEQRGSS